MKIITKYFIPQLSLALVLGLSQNLISFAQVSEDFCKEKVSLNGYFSTEEAVSISALFCIPESNRKKLNSFIESQVSYSNRKKTVQLDKVKYENSIKALLLAKKEIQEERKQKEKLNSKDIKNSKKEDNHRLCQNEVRLEIQLKEKPIEEYILCTDAGEKSYYLALKIKDIIRDIYFAEEEKEMELRLKKVSPHH